MNPPDRVVTVTPANIAERPLLEGLFQFYVHDFSEFAAPESTSFEFDDAGRFAPYPPMASYWTDAKRWPLLIRAGGRIAGFALVNTLSHCGEAIDRNMAEFFVARKYRRTGIATEAARQTFEKHPGTWEVATTMRNLPAISFWPKAIARAPNVRDIRRREQNDKHWRGPIWHFRTAA
jgi:predicted acetyltransferase